MNQLGPLFREARTQSGKTIDDAVRETKIAKKYLIAIENEDFDSFPGETYLLGFLRNYAQFLGLNPDEMVLKYRDYKIQEQPAPIEQLTAKTVNVKRIILIIIIILLIGLSVTYVTLSGKKEKRTQEPPAQDEVAAEVKEEKANIIIFEEEELIRDFSSGDVIEIPKNDVTYIITIDSIGEDLEFSIEDIPFQLSTDERVEIDFNRDGRKDVLIRTNRLGEGTVNLTLKKIFKKATVGEESPITEGVSEGKAEGLPEVVIIREDDLFAEIPVAPDTGFQIISSYEKTEIQTNISVRATAHVGYISDDEEKQEKLMRDGDEISITTKDVLRIMSTNAGGVDIRINDVSFSLGKSGKTVAKIIRWYRDSEDSNLYHLIMDDWEK